MLGSIQLYFILLYAHMRLLCLIVTQENICQGYFCEAQHFLFGQLRHSLSEAEPKKGHPRRSDERGCPSSFVPLGEPSAIIDMKYHRCPLVQCVLMVEEDCILLSVRSCSIIKHG